MEGTGSCLMIRFEMNRISCWWGHPTFNELEAVRRHATCWDIFIPPQNPQCDRPQIFLRLNKGIFERKKSKIRECMAEQYYCQNNSCILRHSIFISNYHYFLDKLNCGSADTHEQAFSIVIIILLSHQYQFIKVNEKKRFTKLFSEFNSFFYWQAHEHQQFVHETAQTCQHGVKRRCQWDSLARQILGN